jgi:hypothetical protein
MTYYILKFKKETLEDHYIYPIHSYKINDYYYITEWFNELSTLEIDDNEREPLTAKELQDELESFSVLNLQSKDQVTSLIVKECLFNDNKVEIELLPKEEVEKLEYLMFKKKVQMI